MVRLKDFRRVLLVKYGSVSDSYTTSLRLRLLFAFHDQLDIMFAIFQIEDMIDIIAFMLLPAIVIVAIYRTVENTINVNISLSSITDPLAAYRYAGSVEIETEFIACMVAENNIAIGLPVAFGHACAVLANYETPVENSIGKDTSSCRGVGFWALNSIWSSSTLPPQLMTLASILDIVLSMAFRNV